MEKQTALAVRDVNLTTWQTIEKIAPAMYGARFFGVANPEQAAAVMLKGFELGLGLAASFEYIHVVQGKPTLSPRGALALVMASGQLTGFKLTKLDFPIGYTCWMKRANGFEHTETFTVADAARAKLVKPEGNWETYPWNMAKWRAVGFCVDVLFSDLCGGMKRSDELGATVNDAGDVITVQTEPVAETPAPQAPEPAPAPKALTLDELVNLYGGEAVIVANEGRIPGTDEEVAAVQAKLETQGAPHAT